MGNNICKSVYMMCVDDGCGIKYRIPKRYNYEVNYCTAECGIAHT
jgi:hypothetical protein